MTPFGTKCNPVNAGDGLTFSLSLLVLLLFELVIVALTIRAVSRNLRSGPPLMKVLYRDSVVFFLILAAVTSSAILVRMLGSEQVRHFLDSPFRVVHAIICCRILLNLKRAALPSGTSKWVTFSIAFANAPGGEMEDETGTIELARFGVRSTGETGSSEQGYTDFVAGSSSSAFSHPP